MSHDFENANSEREGKSVNGCGKRSYDWKRKWKFSKERFFWKMAAGMVQERIEISGGKEKGFLWEEQKKSRKKSESLKSRGSQEKSEVKMQFAKVKREEIIKRPESFLDSPVKPDYDEE
jgi:hypothetical protein